MMPTKSSNQSTKFQDLTHEHIGYMRYGNLPYGNKSDLPKILIFYSKLHRVHLLLCLLTIISCMNNTCTKHGGFVC